MSKALHLLLGVVFLAGMVLTLWGTSQVLNDRAKRTTLAGLAMMSGSATLMLTLA